MQFDLERVRENVRKADTEDLLDRATVYRTGMEPDALDIIEEELHRRGVTAADIDAHARRRKEAGLCDDGGTPAHCAFCSRPAVVREWSWHRFRARSWSWLLLGLPWLVDGLPIFPRRLWYCAVHRPGAPPTSP
jgi:hypothetical protein